MNALDKSSWVERTDHEKRVKVGHKRPVYSIISPYGGELYTGVLRDICDRYHLNYKTMCGRTVKYDQFTVQVKDSFGKMNEREFYTIRYDGIHDFGKNWVKRIDHSPRANSTMRQNLYAVYENDIMVYQGTIGEVREFVGRSRSCIETLCHRYDVFECKSPKGVRYLIAYIGEEYPDHIRCSVCGKVKPISQFTMITPKGKYPNVRKMCKVCESIKSSEHYYKLKEDKQNG